MAEDATVGERAVRELRARIRRMGYEDIDLLRLEEDIREVLNGLGRELLADGFARADFDDTELIINGVHHGRVDRHSATIHTTFGPVEVKRTTYRRDRSSPVVSAFDKVLGIVEKFYTPKTARVVSRLQALLVKEDVCAVLSEVGGVSVGDATVHRLPQSVMARYETRRDEVERRVREISHIPSEAVTVQVGLDGAMVPQDGEYARPRGREPEGEPAPARHERKYGVVGADPPPCSSDGSVGCAWHEASVGTLAYFDFTGEHVGTTYFGRMPEANKATLDQLLRAELATVLAQRPRLRVVFASDGAPGHWNTIAQMRAGLPEYMRADAIELLDFFHAAEHLQDACDAIDGKGSPEGRVRRLTWCETLKEFDNGVTRVLQALRHQRRQAPSERKRELIDTTINYITKNQARMHYKEAIDQHLPIATGPTEAAAKSLVGVRMKRSGARYSQHGGQTILTLLASHRSGRFEALMQTMFDGYTATVRRAA